MKYLVTLILFLTSIISLQAQTEVCDGDLCVVQFNAAFNTANEVTWLSDLTDCDINTVEIKYIRVQPSNNRCVLIEHVYCILA